MTIHPVETTPDPGYPDKYSAGKGILAARPRRWIGAPLATSVLAAAVALGLSGCGQTIVTPGGPRPAPDPAGIETGVETPDWESMTVGFPAAFPIGRIPLFESGEGTGAIGCVAVAAPVFLSEDEAFAILSAAFEQAGLTLDRGTEASITRPVTDLNDNHRAKSPTVCEPLISDGALALQEGMPMIFVSKDDLDAWQGDAGIMSSVQSYDIRGAAQTLSENNDGLLVFYDPMVKSGLGDISLEQLEGESDEAYYARWDAARRQAEQEARAESERLLQAQAEAFLQWLRAEGII